MLLIYHLVRVPDLSILRYYYDDILRHTMNRNHKYISSTISLDMLSFLKFIPIKLNFESFI